MTWPTPAHSREENWRGGSSQVREVAQGLPGTAVAGKGKAASRPKWLQPGGTTGERTLSRALAAAGWS